MQKQVIDPTPIIPTHGRAKVERAMSCLVLSWLSMHEVNEHIASRCLAVVRAHYGRRFLPSVFIERQERLREVKKRTLRYGCLFNSQRSNNRSCLSLKGGDDD